MYWRKLSVRYIVYIYYTFQQSRGVDGVKLRKMVLSEAMRTH